jgi:hypothetical protein
MTRIPVTDTIRFAYMFTFGQIGAIIGLVWLPLMLVALLQFLPYAIGSAYPADPGDPAAASSAALLNLGFSAAALVLYAMNCVSVTRQALGMRSGAASFHFALGRPEWRMFAAIVICGLLLVAALGLYLMAATLPALVPGLEHAPFMWVLATVYALAGLGAIVWFALRLIFLVGPVVVAEERIDLPRAWLLSKGNFWPLLAIAVAVTLPLLLVQCIALAAIVGPGLFAPLPANAGLAAALFEQRLTLFDRHMPSIIGLTLVLTPFNMGLTLGASAAAYRALVPAKPRIT